MVHDLSTDVLFNIKPGTNITITRKGGQIVIAAAGSSSNLEIKELDGSPDVNSVTIVQVQNGTLIDNGAGQVTLGWMEPLTNGDPLFPEVLFDENTGDILMSGVTS